MAITSKLKRHKLMERVIRSLMGANVPPRFKFKDTYASIEVPAAYTQHLPTQQEIEDKFNELETQEEAVEAAAAEATVISKTDSVITSNLEVGTSNLFVDTETGRVGIGTGSPSKNLQVYGTSYPSIVVGGPNSDIRLVTDTASPYNQVIRGTSNVVIEAPANSKRLFINGTNGNVGIGTGSPQEKLHLYGSPMIQHATRYTVNGVQGWYKIGTWDAPDNSGARLKISFLGGEGYGAQAASKGGETIIYASINNNIPTTVSNMSGTIHAYGNPVITQAKFQQVGTDRTKYDIIVYVESYTQHSMSIECTNTSTFTRAWTSASDPGVNSATVQAALFTQVIDNSGNVGIGKTNPSNKLDVVGDIYATGNITGYSDKRAKSDIQKIENALEKLEQINGYTFTMNDKRYTGVIAQEVLPVLPEAVTGSEETHYAVAYGNMMGLIIEAIKELKKKVEQ